MKRDTIRVFDLISIYVESLDCRGYHRHWRYNGQAFEQAQAIQPCFCKGHQSSYQKD